ncbi:MAG: alpha-hydroxy-acid oxidizing protein [Deltaproteobacteria bacterium]|nr:alpha-hydroxy-acid oxidizing protein [Deltaproteobacteria bacterium]
MPRNETPGYDPRFPTVDDLRTRARRRIPRFAFEYLDGGCNEDVNLHRNTAELREVVLEPRYLAPLGAPDLRSELFGHVYDAPFGIAPLGLQGLIWPRSPEILAAAARDHNLPFVLSTVSTASIETVSEICEGRAWYQLYHPTEARVRDDLIDRAAAAGCPVLVVLCDAPSFGYRPRDIRNGLALPPQMTLRNILQMLGRPEWALRSLLAGTPTFENLKPYTPEHLNLRQLGAFMDATFSGRLDADRVGPIRERWKGKLVLKGVASEADAEQAIAMGFDGLIVSNHGGRQLDAGESSIRPLARIAARFGEQTTVMMDSGIRSGPDIARALASGARFTFLGRAFMYGVAALGARGGDHTAEILKTQLRQIVEQLGCERVADLPNHRAPGAQPSKGA